MAINIAMLLVGMTVASPEPPPARYGDFAAYWAAGLAFVQRDNAYDPCIVEQLATENGLSQAFAIWNPPWIMPLLAPLALLPFELSALLWLFVNVILLVLSGILAGRRAGLALVPSIVLSITFVPAMICLGISQWAIVLLTSVVLFAECHHQKHDVVAGLVLALASIKPHPVAMVWLVVLFIGKWRERGRTFAGVFTGIAVLSLLTICWDGHVFQNYLAAVRHPSGLPPTAYYSATIGMWLRMESGLAKHVWVQFLPFLLATPLFTAWLFSRQRASDSVWRVVPASLGCSVLALPYGWHYDQTVLLPIYLAAWGLALSRRGLVAYMLTASLMVLQLGQLTMLILRLEERWHVVFPIGLVAVWLAACRYRCSTSE